MGSDWGVILRPEVGMGDENFKVILPGPDGNYDRLRTPAGATVLVPSSIEAQLNDRQKQIMVLV